MPGGAGALGGGALGGGGFRPGGGSPGPMPGGGMPGAGMMGVPPKGMGMMGAMGGGMFPGMGGGPTLDVEDVPEFVVAIVEVDNLSSKIFKGMEKAKQLEVSSYSVPVKHRWGKSHVRSTPWSIVTFLSQDGKSIESKRLPTVAQRYQEEFNKTFTSDRTDPNLAMDMARWTLQHGLVDKMPDVMKKVSESDPSHPAVKAFNAIHEKLGKVPEADPAGASWRTKLLEGYRVAEDAKHHFALVHGSVSDEIVQSHLDNLERTFRGYYYWFALQGEVLAVPKYRPVAILAKTVEDFNRLHKILTSGPVVVDGFFARRENSAVFAPTRRDPQYRVLEEFNNHFWKNGFDRKDILRGKKNAGYPRGTDEPVIHVVQTLALVQQALEYEGQQTTVSHDGSRQMLYVSDLLPTGVAAPEWLLFGMGSFFETSLQSPWATIAAPSPYYLPRFRELLATKQLEPSSLETLKKVVTDHYFRNLPPRGEDEKSATRQAYETALRKARTTTWSLTYFLAWKHLPELRRYMAELGKMPRDMQLNEKVLWLTFARAFDAVDGDKVDEAKLQRLSVAWLSYISNERFESEATMKLIRDKYREVLDKRKAKEEEKNKKGQGGGWPGFPGMPGGPGGPGGGFGPRPGTVPGTVPPSLPPNPGGPQVLPTNPGR
jgi:hypothetical protein